VEEMKKKCATLFTVAIVLFTQLSASETAADAPGEFLIIANKSVKVNSISKAQLRQIFMKRQESWPDGSRVVPINAKIGSPLRSSFVKEIIGMSSSEEKYYWEKEKIRSGVKPPPEFGNTIKGVFKLKGSVGYCYRSDFIEGVVKIIKLVN